MAKDEHDKKAGEVPPAKLAKAVRASSDDPRIGDGTNITVTLSQLHDINEPQRILWRAIRHHTEQIGFNHFAAFVEKACNPETTHHQPDVPGMAFERFRNQDACVRNGLGTFGFIPGSDLYGVLKLAAEIFLLTRCGICPPSGTTPTGGILSSSSPDDVFGVGDSEVVGTDDLANTLSRFLGTDQGSYIRAIIRNVFGTQGLQASPFCPISVGVGPCLMELIWSYWHEEGMLVQTSNAIALRFQNVARNGRDPLVEFELDPLRPLSGFIWGYIQDEPSRLSVARRAFEYHHHYGFGPTGKATLRVRPADSRTKFLQAFHDLLRLTDQFYREAADNTVTPDPFPLLIALRDLHMILAEGAHNQFRDLPWTARSEMLVQQWLLARTETRDFLRGRLMTPYPEAWMGAVDAMKRLQGWSDTNVIHFSDLARFGERLLLSIRHVRWDAIADPVAAQDWALVWRPEIQGYIHAYRMATGVTLTDDVVEMNRPDAPRYLPPAVLLRSRMLEQRRRAELPAEDGVARLALPSRTVPRQS
jgi:hypothetical protein